MPAEWDKEKRNGEYNQDDDKKEHKHKSWTQVNKRLWMFGSRLLSKTTKKNESKWLKIDVGLTNKKKNKPPIGPMAPTTIKTFEFLCPFVHN